MFRSTLSIFTNNRELVWEMTRRDLTNVNRGAILGYLWLVINPLIQVASYVIVVSVIFKARLSPDSGSLDYAVFVLSGMIPWQIITRSMTSAPSLIRDKMELIKQVIYPIETLPLTNLLLDSFGSLITLIVFILLSLFSGHMHWTIIFLPIPFLLLLFLVLGVSWAFSIIGVIIKDLREVISVLMGLLVYLSPVVVSESIVSASLWRAILWNPLAHVVICFRDVFNAEFHPWSWLIFVTMTLAAFLIGSWIINRAKVLINEYL